MSSHRPLRTTAIAVPLFAIAVAFGTTSARADAPPPVRPRLAAAAPSPDPGGQVDTPPRHAKRARRYLTHANLGILAMSWTGAQDGMPGKMVTLADRQTVLQMFGVGRFVTDHLRVTISVQLAEAVAGAPPGSSTLAMVGVVPWIGWHPGGPLFFGAGPLVAPRIYGKNQLDLGLFTAAGVAFPLGNGFAAGASVQVPVMFRVRNAISIAPATFLSYRF